MLGITTFRLSQDSVWIGLSYCPKEKGLAFEVFSGFQSPAEDDLLFEDLPDCSFKWTDTESLLSPYHSLLLSIRQWMLPGQGNILDPGYLKLRCSLNAHSHLISWHPWEAIRTGSNPSPFICEDTAPRESGWLAQGCPASKHQGLESQKTPS